MQLSKELQQAVSEAMDDLFRASMKCSSRKNCNHPGHAVPLQFVQASMKCSSRKNCNLKLEVIPIFTRVASMKCSSRKNCNGAVDMASTPALLPQ